MGKSELWHPNIIKAQHTTWAPDTFPNTIQGFSRSVESHQKSGTDGGKQIKLFCKLQSQISPPLHLGRVTSRLQCCTIPLTVYYLLRCRAGCVCCCACCLFSFNACCTLVVFSCPSQLYEYSFLFWLPPLKSHSASKKINHFISQNTKHKHNSVLGFLLFFIGSFQCADFIVLPK